MWHRGTKLFQGVPGRKGPKEGPTFLSLPPPAKGMGTLVASRGAIRPRPCCAPLPVVAPQYRVQGTLQTWWQCREGGYFLVGSACLPAPLAQGWLPEPGSWLPLRAFLGEARGAERGWTWSAPCSWGEREEEKKEGEGARGGRGAVEKAARDPLPPQGRGRHPRGPQLPDAPGVRRGEGGRRDPPAPLHRRGPACGERNPSVLPLLPSPPSSLPPSFLPSPGLARGGRGALPAVCFHACPPGRRRAHACPPRPLRPPSGRPPAAPAPPRAR